MDFHLKYEFNIFTWYLQNNIIGDKNIDLLLKFEIVF